MDEALEAIRASARGNQGLQRKIETLEKNAAFKLYQAEAPAGRGKRTEAVAGGGDGITAGISMGPRLGSTGPRLGNR